MTDPPNYSNGRTSPRNRSTSCWNPCRGSSHTRSQAALLLIDSKIERVRRILDLSRCALAGANSWMGLMMRGNCSRSRANDDRRHGNASPQIGMPRRQVNGDSSGQQYRTKPPSQPIKLEPGGHRPEAGLTSPAGLTICTPAGDWGLRRTARICRGRFIVEPRDSSHFARGHFA